MEATMNMKKEKVVYNDAKVWQIGFFALNDAATNITFLLMIFYAFFNQNILGLSAGIIGTIAMLMRVFDGITDPIAGFLIDKTNGKFGKFRPFMFIGNIIIFITILLIFRIPADLPIKIKYIYSTILYGLYILGYTLQTACSKSGQSVLTNNPKRRPLISLFSGLLSMVVFNGGTFFIFTYMSGKYPRKVADPQLWKDTSLVFVVVSLTLTIFAMIGIWAKDRKEFFGLGKKGTPIKFRDGLDVLKNNRPLQMLIVAASTDKLGKTAVRGGLVYFFSNLLLNGSLQGQYSLYAMIPSALLTFLGVKIARKSGMRKSFINFTWAGIVALLILIFITPIIIKSTNFNIILILLVILAIQDSISNTAGIVVMPMIADCADYETHRTGRFIPGLIGTVFSFVDKLVSSMATFLIGMALTFAGYGNTKIPPNTALNSKFTIAVMFIVFGLPLIGHVASIISMKFYDLDDEKMENIKRDLQLRKDM
ncbi:MAG: MFS transporter [Fusobacteriaceae bacterium]|nr:MFS transporter [Fusobacteriaceae bacterium]